MTLSEGAGVRVVLTTVQNFDEAVRLGRAVVEERLAACANIVPGLTSIFRWEGRVQEETEVLLLLKTTEARLDELRSRVVELHAYDVPEVVALPVERGHGPYLEWVREEVDHDR